MKKNNEAKDFLIMFMTAVTLGSILGWVIGYSLIFAFMS